MVKYFLTLFFAATFLCGGEYRIVFIHLGSKLPSFLPVALKQARLFNPNCDIILLANQEALGEFTDPETRCIAIESIPKSQEHKLFISQSTLDRNYRDGFWYYTTERLFCLDDFIQQYDLKNTFHLENDNLLYVDLEELLPLFQEYYPGIGAPFEQDDRGAASFIYVANGESIHAFAEYLFRHCRSRKSEMYLLSDFKKEFGHQMVGHLPNITTEYALSHNPLRDVQGKLDRLPPSLYSNHFDRFQSLFDACSYGQYLGGIDPRNGPDGPGYLNPLAIFNCSEMTFEWKLDEKDRRVPYVTYGGKTYRINNLHIHCKDLQRFTSKP